MPDFYDSFEEEEIFIFRKTINSNTFILKSDIEETITSDSKFNVTNERQLQSDSSIKKTYSKTLNSDAQIKKLGTEGTLNLDIYILFEDSETLNSDVFILKTYSLTLYSDANILYTRVGI